MQNSSSLRHKFIILNINHQTAPLPIALLLLAQNPSFSVQNPTFSVQNPTFSVGNRTRAEVWRLRACKAFASLAVVRKFRLDTVALGLSPRLRIEILRVVRMKKFARSGRVVSVILEVFHPRVPLLRTWGFTETTNKVPHLRFIGAATRQHARTGRPADGLLAEGTIEDEGLVGEAVGVGNVGLSVAVDLMDGAIIVKHHEENVLGAFRGGDDRRWRRGGRPGARRRRGRGRGGLGCPLVAGPPRAVRRGLEGPHGVVAPPALVGELAFMFGLAWLGAGGPGVGLAGGGGGARGLARGLGGDETLELVHVGVLVRFAVDLEMPAMSQVSGGEGQVLTTHARFVRRSGRCGEAEWGRRTLDSLASVQVGAVGELAEAAARAARSGSIPAAATSSGSSTGKYVRA